MPYAEGCDCRHWSRTIVTVLTNGEEAGCYGSDPMDGLPSAYGIDGTACPAARTRIRPWKPYPPLHSGSGWQKARSMRAFCSSLCVSRAVGTRVYFSEPRQPWTVPRKHVYTTPFP